MLLVVGVFFAALILFTLYGALRAGIDARRAKGALLRAEVQLSARQLDPARAELVTARQSLTRMKTHIHGLGPLLPVARVVPVVRSQVVAVETFQSAGVMLTDAGLRLTDAAQQVLENAAGETPISSAVDKLREINASLASGAKSVEVATAKVKTLDGKWLIGPIADARNELNRRLPRYSRQASSTEEGLNALIRFAGGDGPRRYLFLSQNPDELRPTGGFFGTYGTMTATSGELRLDKFEPIHRFTERHPTAVLPGTEAGSPFRFATPPIPQTLGNTNSTPDFRKTGELAARLWNASGEPPIDGLVSFNPEFLARILGVLGPVSVPEYGEVVDEGNLIERFSYYTAQLELDPLSDVTRKGFLAALAEVVMRQLLATPASKWQALGEAVGKGFDAREAMAWSSDPEVGKALASRHWDFVLPDTDGDFFYNGEYSYAAKIDRGLVRSFDHHVELRTDGSARITTTMTITNTRNVGPLNPGSLSYVTIYGPKGALLDRAASDPPPISPEPTLSGHPAAGWFLNAPPLLRAKMTVVWDVKDLLGKGPGGTRVYSLWWMKIPGHTGDVVNLRVDPPRGWGWTDGGPPAQFELNSDLHGTWRLAPSKT